MLENPLFKEGLTLTQKSHYFASLLYFFNGWIRLVFLMVPLAFLLFEIPPILSDTTTLLLYFLPHYILSHHLFHQICKQYRNPFWSDVYETGSSFWLAWTAFVTFFRPEKVIFNVTPKGQPSLKHEVFHWRHMLPHIILMGLLLIGLGLGTYRFVYGTMSMDLFAVTCAWAVFNIVLLATSIEVAREHPHHRTTHRLKRSIAFQLAFEDTVLTGKTTDISDHGAGLIVDEQTHIDQHVRLSLYWEDEPSTVLEAEVMRSEWLEDGTSKVAVRFTNLSHTADCAIIRHMFSPPNAWSEVTHPRRSALRSLSHIAGVTVRKRRKKLPPAKVHGPRMRKMVACSLMSSHGPIHGFIQDLGSTGAVVCVESKVAPHKRVKLELELASGGTQEIVAEVIHRIPSADHHTRYEVHFVKPAHVDHHAFKEVEVKAS